MLVGIPSEDVYSRFIAAPRQAGDNDSQDVGYLIRRMEIQIRPFLWGVCVYVCLCFLLGKRKPYSSHNADKWQAAVAVYVWQGCHGDDTSLDACKIHTHNDKKLKLLQMNTTLQNVFEITSQFTSFPFQPIRFKCLPVTWQPPGMLSCIPRCVVLSHRRGYRQPQCQLPFVMLNASPGRLINLILEWMQAAGDYVIGVIYSFDGEQ